MTRFDPSRPFGVVCNDAGGANQIAAMLAQWDWRPAWVMLGGPAVGIWRQNFPNVRPVSGFHWLKEASALITGTGWASELEHQARCEARRWGRPSVAVLDHWTNYRERFNRNGVEVLPDEIWVVDVYAEKMALRLFPATEVALKQDYYAEREAMQIAPVTKKTPSVLLYLLEPIRSDWGLGEPGEFQALRYFLERMSGLGLPSETEVHLRPHPSEAQGKYDSFLNDGSNIKVRMASGNLAEALSGCRWVAGCQTYAMTLALRAGRGVFCALPPWAPMCVLPHQGIVHLRNAIAV